MQTASPSAPAMPEARPAHITPAPAAVPFKVRGKRKAKKQDASRKASSPSALPWGRFIPDEGSPEIYAQRRHELDEAKRAFGLKLSVVEAMTPANSAWLMKALKFSLFLYGYQTYEDSKNALVAAATINLPCVAYESETFFIKFMLNELHDIHDKLSDLEDAVSILGDSDLLKNEDFETHILSRADGIYHDMTEGILEEEGA